MQLKQDAYVVTADNQDVGRLDRVVIDPRTREITHLVVRQGTLLITDKVVPISLVAGGIEDRVTLRAQAGDLQALPDFEEAHFIPVNEPESGPAGQDTGQAAALYWYPPLRVPGEVTFGEPGPLGPAYVVEKTENIPEGTVALKEGAKVLTADKRQVGNVEQVLTDPLADRVTHFLVSQGVFFKEKKLVPTTWVSEVNENEVRLWVGKNTLDQLQGYHARGVSK